MLNKIKLIMLDEDNELAVRAIQREDVSTAFVDTAETIIALTHYGKEHGCIGYTFAIYAGEACVGVLLLGEAIPWETDPPEMSQEPFYRLMGFMIDRHWRGRGIGSYALENAIQRVYADFGIRPVALGVHVENARAAEFYMRHGFVPTNAMEGNDRYYLRYPKEK